MARPKGIIARNDPRVRLLEGLEQNVTVLHGDIPDKVAVREGKVEYDVDLRHGQKTGAFLDQRENRIAAAQYVSGRTLDCFSYAGGFALQLAPHVDELTALDISEDATALLARNAARNGLSNVQVRTTNVFDELRTLERMGETFDSIVLDPPAFAKSKAAIPKALSGYKEINLRALKLLKPGGFLITCSCSYHVNEADVRRSDSRRGARRAGGRQRRGEADAGAGPSRRARDAGDVLPEVLYSPQARIETSQLYKRRAKVLNCKIPAPLVLCRAPRIRTRTSRQAAARASACAWT